VPVVWLRRAKWRRILEDDAIVLHFNDGLGIELVGFCEGLLELGPEVIEVAAIAAEHGV
jgi:hypothetical protein